MATVPERQAVEQSSGSRDRFWTPRFWDGMNLTGWIRLLVRNRFAVGPTYGLSLIKRAFSRAMAAWVATAFARLSCSGVQSSVLSNLICPKT